MPDGVTRTTLKASRKRTVSLERWREDGAERGRVVKHFHDRGPFGFVQDRRRARGEHGLLAGLGRAGVRVPAPLDLRRVGRGWQVVMEWLPDTTSLEAWLDGARPPHLPSSRVAAAVGHLLASLHAAGLDHADLHAGNVLLDAAGAAWMIDFHQARLRGALSVERMIEDLVATAARGREATSERFRARVMLAWRRALPAETVRSLPNRVELAERVEARARERRRAEIAADRRWSGAGGFLRALRVGDARVLHRRELPAALAAELARLAAGRVDPLVEARVPAGVERCLVLRGDAADAQRWWRTAGRLWQHRVPALVPLALGLRRGAASWVALRAPLADAEAAPAKARLGAGDAAARRLARAAGALVGALHDRGLAPCALESADLHVEDGGARARAVPLRLDPRVTLVEVDPRPGRRPARFAGLLAGEAARASRSERAAFLTGYLAAFRGGAAERRALRAELGGAGGARR